jgi:hypothetical protein
MSLSWSPNRGKGEARVRFLWWTANGRCPGLWERDFRSDRAATEVRPRTRGGGSSAALRPAGGWDAGIVLSRYRPAARSQALISTVAVGM